MKVVFMGTPDFAVPALDSIAAAGHRVEAVVTRADAKRGRGKKVVFSPVKEKAIELGIPVLQPDRIKGNEEFMVEMEKIRPDVIVVAAYGRILPEELLKLPTYGCINIHGSILPRFRGAAPIQAAILEGDEETGITLMQMDEGLDTGDMLMKRTTPIDMKTAGQLHDELAEMGAEMIVDILGDIDNIHPEPQDEALATYAPMISKEDGRIDFAFAPEKIERRTRAFDPWPGTFTQYGEDTMKLWKVETIDTPCEQAPGTIVDVSDEGIDVSCGGGLIRIKELQMPGRKRVPIREYLKGNTIEIGRVLG